MTIAEQQQLVILEEFQRRAQARTREQRAGLEQERQFDREKREARREEKQREYLETLAAIERASEAQIASFYERLTHYDTAIVEALMENEQALDDTGGKLNEMRAQAHALPDGRKVFKTTDGRQVFDEHGAAVGRDTLDPDAIGQGKPCWESFKTQLDARTQLEQERRALLEFQARADKAREKAGEEGISGKELDAIGAELEQAMPEAVRRKLAAQGHHAGADLSAPSTSQLPAMPATSADRSRKAEDFSPAR
jgi:hypothetical protein